MVSALISRVIILVFGTLYPAYSSYKAVKTKNVKEYVKWMMYWIVFALFTTAETFADTLISWFPFYYEMKIIFVVWLLSPATKGSSVLYRKFVHPELLRREGEIDQALDRVKTQGYSALLNVGSQGINFAVQSALTGQSRIVDQIKKSYSLNDIAQEPGSRPSYQPRTEQILESPDEPDFFAPPTAPRNEMPEQGEKVDCEKPYTPPTEVPTSPSGYNLRSHEYHGNTQSSSQGQPPKINANPAQRHSYHHQEGYHYGTLPRRSASMRSSSSVNAPLPSRWRRPNNQ